MAHEYRIFNVPTKGWFGNLPPVARPWNFAREVFNMFGKASAEHTFEDLHKGLQDQATESLKASRVFGQNFKTIRNEMGLSCLQMAVRIGITEDRVTGIEAGVLGQVDFDLLVMIAIALKLRYQDLTAGID